MKILNHLKERSIFKNITNENKFEQLQEGSGVYIGFDPTANSLHLGNYIQIVTLLRFQKFGFVPVALIGGATGLIGDPSGRKKERAKQEIDTINQNKTMIIKQLKSFGLKVIDNLSFYQNTNVLTFIRQVGKLINVNYLLNKEVIATRLDTGISFAEFTYQLIQGWDFKCLYTDHNVQVQVGGSDQWGNITTGIEIIRKISGDKNQAVGITTNLLTTIKGTKFGKSEGNVIWLNKKLTSPFMLYQYLFNLPDEDAIKLLKWITFLPMQKIIELSIDQQKNPFQKKAHKELAFEVVKDVHSLEDALLATKISQVLFGTIPVNTLSTEEVLSLEQAIPTFNKVKGKLIDVLVDTQIAKSKREAREFLNSGAIEVNGEKVTDENFQVKAYFSNEAAIIKKGKKYFFLIKF